jgi:hypothetical protein
MYLRHVRGAYEASQFCDAVQCRSLLKQKLRQHRLSTMTLVFVSACAVVLLTQFALATSFPNTSREFYLRTVVDHGSQKLANLYRM